MLKKIFLTELTFCMILISRFGEAGLYFNPNFLSDIDNVADLSIYEKGMQGPGEYVTNIYLNDVYQKQEDLVYKLNESNLNISGKNRGLYPCVSAKLLKDIGVKVSSFELPVDTACLNVQDLSKDATLSYDFFEHRLNISFPQIYINQDALESIPQDQWDNGINAFLLNYNLSSNYNQDNENYFLNLDSGLNIGGFRLRNNSTFSLNKNGDHSTREWNSIATYLEKSIPQLKSNLILGESYSSSPVFDGVGFLGLRLSTASEMKPNSLQGFAPTVTGIAQTRAKVTIKQNGNTIYQTFVSPGPFNIDDLYPTGSSGDLEVIIEESDGSQQIKFIPFSTVPVLQRAKNFTYDFVIGDFRSGNQSQGDTFFTQGTFIYGVNNHLTVYGGTQLASKYQAINAGIGSNFGKYGAFSVDLTHAESTLFDDSHHTGQSLRFLYSKSMNKTGTTFRLLGYRYSTKGFYTLNDVAYLEPEGYEYEKTTDADGNIIYKPYSYYNLFNNKKGRFQLSVTQNLKNYGNFHLSLDRQDYWNTTQTSQNFSFGYSNFWKSLNYGVSYNISKNIGFNETEKIFSFNLSLPLDALFRKVGVEKSVYLTSSIANSDTSGTNSSVGLTGSLLKDNNLAYYLNRSSSDSSKNAYSLGMNYTGSYGSLSAGYYAYDQVNSYSLNASGGMLLHRDGITFGQLLGDTTILVKAKGAADVGVENIKGVETNRFGYAIIPYADAYRYNRVSLNVNDLKSNVDLMNNVKTIVPTRGAVVLSEFNTKLGFASLITILKDGKQIPFGSIAMDESGESSGIVGDESQVYLTGLKASGMIKIKTSSHLTSICSAPYRIPETEYGKNVILLNLNCEVE